MYVYQSELSIYGKMYCFTVEDFFKRAVFISYPCDDYNLISQSEMLLNTQQDYYDLQCSTLLHRYCTGTYTEVIVLLL